MTELVRVPSKGFYKLLDQIAENEKTTRDYFEEALTLARREKFTDLEIALLMKDYLKDKIPKTTLHRWTKALEPTEEIEESTSESVPLEQIDENKDPEETPTETPKENPLEIENQFLKEENANLKDAMSKMEQFKPGTVFLGEKSEEEIKEIKDSIENSPTVFVAGEDFFTSLKNKADGIHSFYYDAYGIDLFKNRELSQLKNSGVRVFKRLYFEV